MWQLFSEPIGSHKTLNTYLLLGPLAHSEKDLNENYGFHPLFQ